MIVGIPRGKNCYWFSNATRIDIQAQFKIKNSEFLIERSS